MLAPVASLEVRDGHLVSPANIPAPESKQPGIVRTENTPAGFAASGLRLDLEIWQPPGKWSYHPDGYWMPSLGEYPWIAREDWMTPGRFRLRWIDIVSGEPSPWTEIEL